MSGYFDYYNKTIEQYPTGLKLVSGGTGLGKTSSIPDVINKALPSSKKAIYVANRIQLLDEMAEAMPSEQVIKLPRDLESVYKTLKKNRNIFDHLLAHPVFNAHTENIDIALVNRTVKFLDELFSSSHLDCLPSWQEDIADRQARVLLWAIRNVILTAQQKSQSDYITLLEDIAIQSLFPFIAFMRQDNIRLLLISIHKLYYGFFDGTGTVTANKLSNYVIFADEFDFLEKNLIRLITRGRQIDDPFRFVGFFHREMEKHKLHLQTYPVSASKNIRDRIDNIMEQITKLNLDGIRYPDINQFISTQNPQDAAIFRTSHTVSSTPLYLCQTNRAFDIMTNPDKCESDIFSARRLFTVVSGVSDRILTLLKELEEEDPRTHAGLISDCYRSTTFPEQIRQVSQFPSRRPPQSTRLGSLLDAGFSMYDIHYIAKATDPEEVELRNYAIYVTPEKFMVTLAKNNLVFALSATADIPRCVNNFNLKWLGAKDGVQVLYPNADDAAIIHDLNDEKAKKRDSKLNVVKLRDLDKGDIWIKGLLRFIENVAHLDEFGNDTKYGHLKQRVEHFFASLIWASEQPKLVGEAQSHLIFLNTYRQIKLLFDTEILQNNPFYSVNLRQIDKSFDVYELTFNSYDFLVVFYNAEQARHVHQDQESQDAFNALFAEDIPVVVVTQYLSAGNGVNLQYQLSDGRQRDFLNLHLLETPYFYFDTYTSEDTSEEKAGKIKENLWYLAKLNAAKYLSDSEFRSRLGTLHKPSDWNTQYQYHPRMYADYQLNTLASMIQALGRIERVWESMPEQSVVLCQEAYHVFRQFLEPQFDGLRQRRELVNSHNLKQLLAFIEGQIPIEEREIRRKRDTRLVRQDKICEEKIEGLVGRFSQVRNAIDERDIRTTWLHLRLAGLKHDFADETLQHYDCVFSSPYLQDGKIHLTPNNEIIPVSLAQPDTRQWRFNNAYDVIADNETIREHFSQRGYELDFELDGTHGFVPFFFQAILLGAIGEEAVQALLTENQISVESTPMELFEVADMKVANKPWYIDCKNYSDNTLALHQLFPDSPQFYYKFTDEYFAKRAIEKWHQISRIEGHESKLIYINLATKHERPLGYFRCTDSGLKTVNSFLEADVIVIQGALDTTEPNKYQPTFIRFIEDLEKEL